MILFLLVFIVIFELGKDAVLIFVIERIHSALFHLLGWVEIFGKLSCGWLIKEAMFQYFSVHMSDIVSGYVGIFMSKLLFVVCRPMWSGICSACDSWAHYFIKCIFALVDVIFHEWLGLRCI